MPRIIFKCPYIKGGTSRAASHLKNFVSYIATREGAERIDFGQAHLSATEKQKELIEQLTREFPLNRGLSEYQAYLSSATRGNASAFIARAFDENLDQIAKRENYVEYIANRPRTERISTHGLFTCTENPLVLSQIADAVAHHSGNVWLPIISLRREDAARFGYDNAENWRALLASYAPEMAKAMKIPQKDFRWYAAFHDEGNHPHVHMICYSADPAQGFLTSKGIATIKGDLTKQIFRQELTELYARQTKQRNALAQSADEIMKQLIQQMQNGTLQNDRIERLITYLAQRLQNLSGKKQYGYLPAPLKSIVDAIVDELSRDPRIAEAYQLWYEMREEVLRTYKDDFPERLPLSRQKEFKHIKNIVIQEAIQLNSTAATPADLTQPPCEKTSAAALYQASTRLLHHMSNMFQEQSPPASGGTRVILDSKLRRKIREKKMALGHNADDHEDIGINMKSYYE